MAKLIPAPPNLTAVTNALTLVGPTGGLVSVASTNFTVALSPVGSTISGTVVVTPAASDGTFTPTTVPLTTGAPSATFTYTPASSGSKTVTVTNNGGLSNPSGIGYTVTASATVPAAPNVGTITAGANTVSVPFSPNSNGGATILDYTATLSTGQTATSASSPIVFTVYGAVARTATVTARNSVGSSTASGVSNAVTIPQTNLTFNSSQTWTSPVGVTNLISLSGKGQDGTAGTSGTSGPPTNRSAVLVDVTFTNSIGGGDNDGRYFWQYLQNEAPNSVFVINGGGSGNVTKTLVEAFPGTQFTATYNLSNDQIYFTNAIPNSATYSYNAGWKTIGQILNSGAATISWQEYGTTSPGTPGTTGADTTGFGRVWGGGVNGAASVITLSNVAISANFGYALVIPSGGYLTITY